MTDLDRATDQTESRIARAFRDSRALPLPTETRRRILASINGDLPLRIDERARPRVMTRVPWMAVAAAIVLGATAGLIIRTGTSGPNDRQARIAAEQVQLVLFRTSTAVRRAQTIAVSSSVGEPIASASAHLPVVSHAAEQPKQEKPQ